MEAERKMTQYEMQLRNEIRRLKKRRIDQLRLDIMLMKRELDELEKQDLTLLEEPTNES